MPKTVEVELSDAFARENRVVTDRQEFGRPTSLRMHAAEVKLILLN